MNKTIKKALNIAKKNGVNIWLPNIKTGDILYLSDLGIELDELSFDVLYVGRHDRYSYSYELGEDDYLTIKIEDISDGLETEEYDTMVKIVDLFLA